MSKTLSNILTVFKVARVIAKVVFILCIVGAAGCLLAFAALPVVGTLLSREGINISHTYLGCIVGLIACVGEIVFAFLAERYFKNVLAAGTPFTFDGSKECFRLGITSIIISVATSIIAGFAAAICMILTLSEAELDFDMSISLSTGLFFLFTSLIFKYGAEVKKAAEVAEASQNAQSEYEEYVSETKYL